METKILQGFSLLNKPIRFWGLSSLQLGGSGLGSIILFLILAMSGRSLFGLFLITGTWILLIKGPLKKLHSEHKKGTPDYFASLRCFQGSPRKILDKKIVFPFLIQTQNAD